MTISTFIKTEMHVIAAYNILLTRAESLGLELVYSTDKFTLKTDNLSEHFTSIDSVDGFLRGYKRADTPTSTDTANTYQTVLVADREGGQLYRVYLPGGDSPEFAVKKLLPKRCIVNFQCGARYDWFAGEKYPEALWRSSKLSPSFEARAAQAPEISLRAFILTCEK